MRNLLLLLIPIYLGIHLFTLSRFPLPDFEESVTASAASGMYKYGVSFIHQDLGVLQTKVIQDSPLIIFANNFIISNLDNILFNHRILGLAIGILLLITVFIYFNFLENGSYKNAASLLILAFFFDPLFNKSTHGNGAAIISVFFLLISLRNEILNKDYKFYSTLISGFFMALAMLAYFPIASFIPFLFAYKAINAISDLLKQQYVKSYHLLFWPLSIILFYCPWPIFSHMNVFNALIDVWTPHLFWDVSASVPYATYVIIAFTIILSFYAAVAGYYELEFTKNIVLFSGIIISFFFSNPDWINNLILVLPFFYLLIFCLLPLNTTTNEARAGRYIPLAIICGMNILLFLMQSIYVFVDFNNRSGIDQKEFVQKMIPADREVIGDARNCFSALENRNTFYSLKSSKELNSKLQDSQIEYVMVSEHFEHRDQFAQNTLEYHHYQKLGSIHYESSEISQFLSGIFISDQGENELYSTSVYKKKR